MRAGQVPGSGTVPGSHKLREIPGISHPAAQAGKCPRPWLVRMETETCRRVSRFFEKDTKMVAAWCNRMVTAIPSQSCHYFCRSIPWAALNPSRLRKAVSLVPKLLSGRRDTAFKHEVPFTVRICIGAHFILVFCLFDLLVVRFRWLKAPNSNTTISCS